ncbi:MAG TPA: Ig-like domain-containing protein, partial [Candidatus Limnocylindrales bacterium]
WAVQAVAPLHVVTTIPANQSTRVPRDTGIEVVFDQDGVVLAEAKPFMSISPATKGSFIQKGRSIAFAPAQPLKTATLYRVTVRHGLPLHGTSMTLERDVTFAFETKGGRASAIRVTFERPLAETSTSEGAVLRLRVDSSGDGGPVSLREAALTVHRLRDMSAAIDAWARISSMPDWAEFTGSAPIPTGNLPLAVRATARVQRFDPELDWTRWMRVPKLAAGWYVATVTVDRVPRQAVIQVTDVAAYAMVTTTRTLVWVNDLRTRAPLRGARASLAGAGLGRTGGEGLLVAATPARYLRDREAGDSPVVIVRSGTRGAFVPVDQSGTCDKCDGSRLSGSSDWWNVFQPDRYRYRATDTVNAWGVLRHRGSLVAPASVEVRLLASGDATSEVAVATTTATPDASGAFSVSIPVKDLPYGGYRLVLATGGSDVTERGLEVGPILKPAWTLALATNRHAVLNGEPVDVTATAAFFEGTPVAGASLSLTATGDPTVATTSAAGTSTTRLALRKQEEWGQWEQVNVEARPANPEEGEITAATSVTVFDANVVVQLRQVVKPTRLTISGSVHDVAWGRFERAGTGDPDVVSPYGRVVPGTRVRVSVIEHSFTRRRSGSTYDFITKRTVPTYTTEEHTRTLPGRTVTTDANGAFRLVLPVHATDRSYETTATAIDRAGNRTTARDWSSEDAPFGSGPFAWLQSADPPADGHEQTYPVGSHVRVVYSGGGARTATSRYLWTTVQDGLRSWRITTAPRLTQTFTKASVPGVGIYAVRFTGSGYQAASAPFTAPFRAEDRRLTVTVTPDRARYAPGDHATLTVRTTGRDGAPVPASVFLRVIDEKLYAMGLADDEDPLGVLYQSLESGVLGVGWTHETPAQANDGGGGDTTGGGGDARTDFRDWLVARLVRTGPDGRATVAVDLSDDLTSWHATASAVTASLRAGMGSATMPVGLPFFAEVTVAPTYLVADRPVIGMRAFGTALGAGDDVVFTVSSDTLPMAAVSVRVAAFSPAEVVLPALSPGSHRLQVVATTGSGATARQDTLVRTFEVVSSRAVQTASRVVPLTGATPVETGEGLTTLVLSDAGRGRVVPVLESLIWAPPLRADQALAAALAGRTLLDTFNVAPLDVQARQGELSRFQQDSGVSVVPYASPDLELSALAAMSGDPRINREQLATYFRDVETSTRERTIWALAGRAALGDATQAMIRTLASENDLSVREQVALAVAALAAGDEPLAGRLERQVLNANGARLGPWVRVVAPDPDVEASLTARLAIVAASLGDPIAADMDAFLDANPPSDTVVDLERALAAGGWAARVAPADASAWITVDGSRRELGIAASTPVSVVLTPAQASSARLEPGNGSVLVTTTTAEPFDPRSLTAPDGQSITRTVTPGTTVQATDIVTVDFSVTPAGRGTEGCWIVTDNAPSGIVPIPAPTDVYGGDEEDVDAPRTIWPMDITGQRVSFCVGHDPKHPTAHLRYLARVITPGEYRWEPTVLQSALIHEQGSWVPEETLTIRPLTK